jgi:hypothetical protein
MLKRFRDGRPLQGEVFAVVREILGPGDAREDYLAVESIGSNVAAARINRAARFGTELEARTALGI